MNSSAERVTVSPDGLIEEGKNCNTSDEAIRVGGEEVKLAKKLMSPKKVYLMTSRCDEVRLLCTTWTRETCPSIRAIARAPSNIFGY